MGDKLLTLHRCQEIFAELLKHSEADETELLIAGGTHALTRFANNTIHQNVAEEGYALSVRTSFGQRTARATTNRFDSESLARVVAEASTLARQQQPDPELLPMPGPQQYQAVERWHDGTANATADERAAGRFDIALQPVAAKALLHGHCHQKSFGAMGAVEQALRLVPGLEVATVESSCCGMAGAFGYQAETLDVSMKMAEASLLPAVRAADEQTLVVADGFSCRCQISHGAHREALHVAQVLRKALAR